MERRFFLKSAFAWLAAFLLPLTLRPTPSIADEEDITPSLTSGPYFKPDSPLRTSFLEPDISGSRISLSGLVVSVNGETMPNALLDFWQADSNGNYDNAGYKLRGHQFTNRLGQYSLETIIPGGYSGRTRHIHVRVQPSGGSILTTQLFFPEEPMNQTDFLFRPELMMKVTGSTARFDFVLPAESKSATI
jgi:protocatechuate 3,4-dioxygenase beta subunit